MTQFTRKKEVEKALDIAGIKIGLTRCPGANGSQLIRQSYGMFFVNAIEVTDPSKIKAFQAEFSNVSITINH